MKSKIDKYLKYAAAVVFVATLAINSVVTLDDPFVYMSNEAIATGTIAPTQSQDSISFISWWNSKTHKCESGIACMTYVYFEVSTNGSYNIPTGTLGVGATLQSVRMTGKHTECTKGDEVAHCSDCTGRECVVPNDKIIEMLQAHNGNG